MNWILRTTLILCGVAAVGCYGVAWRFKGVMAFCTQGLPDARCACFASLQGLGT